MSLFNISHFSSTVCSEVMSKRTQIESGEDHSNVKTKNKSDCKGSPNYAIFCIRKHGEERSYESQSPWSAKAEEYDRTGQPVVGRGTSHAPGHHHKQFVESSYSARYSGWDDDKAWSCQEWKADKLMDDRTRTPVVCSRERTHEFQSRFSREHKHVIIEEEENPDEKGTPVVCTQRGARLQQLIIGDDVAELELSLGSRSFLDRVNDQVRKRQKRSSMNVTENDETHCVIWRIFMWNHMYSWERSTQTIGSPSRIQKTSQ